MAERIGHSRVFNYYSWDPALAGKMTLCEYIWIDGSGRKMRSKTRIYQKVIKSLEELEWWTYDGSSTEQATTTQSEIWLKPVCFCKDPFRGENSILVLCETYTSDKETPARYNFRYFANKIMNDAKTEDPWFGIEQEFFLYEKTGTFSEWPLGWPKSGYPSPQGQYYCSVGEGNAFGRTVIEVALRCFLSAGLKIAGINAEVAPGQWEYQVGITKGIECGDHMWLSRYILDRVGEEFGVSINYDPKPIKGDWNGSGAHTNFSTNKTRAENGLEYIEECMKKLEFKHKEHLILYGEGNEQRLTGKHETSSMEKFNYGEANRAASCRIPSVTAESKSGYFEDRRPASNIDPYLVTGALVDTICLNGKYLKDMLQAYKNSVENNF